VMLMTFRIDGNHRYGWTRNRRSPFVSRTRLPALRRKTISCWRNAAFSASSRLRDLNSEASRAKMNPSRAKHRAQVRRFCRRSTRIIFSVHTGLKLTEAQWTSVGLWLAIVASGLYHGVNPGMGWPLAVSAGLMDRSSHALVVALWPLTVGHLLAMLVVILPFALLVALVELQQQIQIGASLLVIGFGVSSWSTDAIRGFWGGSNRRNWGSGPLPWRSRMARD
jgi:hypothetical protein